MMFLSNEAPCPCHIPFEDKPRPWVWQEGCFPLKPTIPKNRRVTGALIRGCEKTEPGYITLFGGGVYWRSIILNYAAHGSTNAEHAKGLVSK